MFPCEKVFQKKKFLTVKKYQQQKVTTYNPFFYLVNGKKSNIASVASSIKYSRSLSLKNHGINYNTSSHFIVDSLLIFKDLYFLSSEEMFLRKKSSIGSDFLKNFYLHDHFSRSGNIVREINNVRS